MMPSASRRSFLFGLAAAGATTLLPRRRAQAAPGDKNAVVLVFLSGGHNALFGSADSFLTAGSFGVTSDNIQLVGDGVYVDKSTFGAMPAIALASMATIGVRHGLSSHDVARPALWNENGVGRHLKLAQAMGGTAPIKCASIGRAPAGANLAVGDVSLQRVSDLAPLLEAVGVRSGTLARGTVRAGLGASRALSGPLLGGHPGSLRTLGEGYAAIDAVLGAVPPAIDMPAIATAYGMTATRTSVFGDFRSSMMAAEALVRLGTNVVCVGGPGLDSHGDLDGTDERARMTRIMPGVNTFLSRMMALPGYNVTTAIFSDFARSLPGSDHAPCLSATVIGKSVRRGTTGRVAADVTMPVGTPGIPGFWSYLGKLGGVASEPFGANPHALIVS